MIVYINEKVYLFSLTSIMLTTKRKISVRNKEYSNNKFEYQREERIQIFSSGKEMGHRVVGGVAVGQVVWGHRPSLRSGGRTGFTLSSKRPFRRDTICISNIVSIHMSHKCWCIPRTNYLDVPVVRSNFKVQYRISRCKG